MIRRITAISLVLVFMPICVFADVDWLRKYLPDSNLSVTGSKTVVFKSDSVTGNRELFDDSEYTRPPETNLTLAGKILKSLSVNATFA